MSHFFVIIQSGQKFVSPAMSGITPKKNSLLPVTKPAAISPRPSTILNGLHIFLILFTFMKFPLNIFDTIH